MRAKPPALHMAWEGDVPPPGCKPSPLSKSWICPCNCFSYVYPVLIFLLLIPTLIYIYIYRVLHNTSIFVLSIYNHHKSLLKILLLQHKYYLPILLL